MLIFFYGQSVSLVLGVQPKARLGLTKLTYSDFTGNILLLFADFTSYTFSGVSSNSTDIKSPNSLDLIILEREWIKTA